MTAHQFDCYESRDLVCQVVRSRPHLVSLLSHLKSNSALDKGICLIQPGIKSCSPLKLQPSGECL